MVTSKLNEIIRRMKIKDYRKATELPERSSMRKSSSYDSWDCYHHCGKSLCAWTNGFVEKHVNEDFDDVYSLYCKSLKEKHVAPKDYDEMIWYFKDLINYNEKIRPWYHWRDGYCVDDENIIRKVSQPKKNKDIVIRLGEPEVHYTLSTRLKNNPGIYRFVCNALIESFGYVKGTEMIEDGIDSKVRNCYDNSVCHFNNISRKADIDAISSYPLRYYPKSMPSWEGLWEAHYSYPETFTYVYGTKEYYRYVAERQKARNRAYRESKKNRIEEFNRKEEALEAQRKLQKDIAC